MDTVSATTPPPLPVPSVGLPTRIRVGVQGVVETVWGVASLTVGLAILAAIPVVNLACLGYMLAAAGRVAETGRLRAGFPGVAKAARLGKIAFGTWLVLWPLRAVAQLADAAALVDPDGQAAAGWQLTVTIMLVLTVLHIVWACVRGGRLRHFLWPAPRRFWRWLRQGGKYCRLRDGFCGYFFSLRLPHYWWLGLRCTIGTLAWLTIPIAFLMVAAGAAEGPAALLSFIGAVLLMPVVCYLPWLQMRFVETGRLRAFRELRVVREWFARRPFAIWLGTLIILGAAVPLYLLKVELAPEEIRWLPAAFFVILTWPARLLVGRLAGAARRAEKPAPWPWRWLWRPGLLMLAFGYVLAVYLSQYLSWDGTASLLQQHAFLVPGPGS